MGNVPGAAPQGGFQDLPSYLNELPNCPYVSQVILGVGKILKSLKCQHDEGGSCVVKIFIKKEEKDLTHYVKQLELLRSKFSIQLKPGVIVMQKIDDTPRAAFLIRQYFAHNLFDRFDTHPYLTLIEKKWITFQLLTALVQMHDAGVRHGDLKTENLMITTWGWLFVVDLAWYKPAYLPVDNPADYTTYFEISSRRRCYLAPERFTHGEDYASTQEEKQQPGLAGSDGLVTAAMDIFSAGCCIAELFLEGETIFDLEGLLAYRDGRRDVTTVLQKIPDQNIRRLVAHMIQRDPAKRFSARKYLKHANAFPTYLHTFYTFVGSLLDPKISMPDLKVQALKHYQHRLLQKVVGELRFPRDQVSEEEDVFFYQPQPSSAAQQAVFDSGQNALRDFIQRLEVSLGRLDEPGAEGTTEGEGSSAAPPLSGRSEAGSCQEGSVATNGAWEEEEEQLDLDPLGRGRGNGLIVIVSVILSCVQNVRYSLNKLSCLSLMLRFGPYLDAQVILDRLVPYAVCLLSDSDGVVRASAVQSLTKLFSYIRAVPASDAHIFQEYIFPALSRFPSDPDELVQLVYAQSIVLLIETAKRFLDMSTGADADGLCKQARPSRTHAQQNSAVGESETGSDGLATRRAERVRMNIENRETNKTGDFRKIDSELGSLQDLCLKVVIKLLTEGGTSVKCALLACITRICILVGRSKVNNELLPHLITVLNSRDWLVRAAFLEHVTGLGVVVGREAFQNFILPCLEQALFDVEETVTRRVLHALASLCELGLLERRLLIQFLPKIIPLLCLPSAWIRNEAIHLLVSLSRVLGLAKTFCFVIPALRPVLKAPIVVVDWLSLAHSLKPPLTRQQVSNMIQSLEADSGVASSSRLPVSSSSLPSSSIAVSSLLPARIPGSSSPPTDVDLYQQTQQQTDNSKGSTPPGVETEMDADVKKVVSTYLQRMAGKAKQVGLSLHQLPGFALGRRGNGADHSDASFLVEEMYRRASDRVPVYVVSIQRTAPDYSQILAQRSGQNDVSSGSAAAVGTPGGAASATGSGVPSSSSATGLSFSMDTSPPLSAPAKRLQARIDLMAQQHQSFSAGFSLDNNNPSPGGSSASSLAQEVAAKALPGSMTASAQLTPTDSFQDGKSRRRPLVIKQPKIQIAEYVKNALELPQEPPQHGKLVLSSLSFSKFYRNFHALSVVGYAEPRPAVKWEPKGVLLTSLLEHDACVNALALSRDNMFLVSGGLDGKVLVWDVSPFKFQPVARSAVTHLQGGRVYALCMCDDSHAVAAANDQGQLRVFKIEIADAKTEDDHANQANKRIIGKSEIRTINCEAEGALLAVEHFNSLCESVLVGATQRGNLYGWDLRAKPNSVQLGQIWSLKVPPALGLITKLAVGPSPFALVVGTTRGFLLTWDLRFQIPVQVWHHHHKTAITALQTADTVSILPPELTAERSQPLSSQPFKGPLVFAAAAGSNEIAGFDLFTNECRAAFRVVSEAGSQKLNNVLSKGSAARTGSHPTSSRSNSSSSIQTGSHPASSRSNSSTLIPTVRAYEGEMPGLDETFFQDDDVMKAATNRNRSIRSFLISPEQFCLTGGSDATVRYWDLRQPRESYRVVGRDLGPFSVRYDGKREKNLAIFQEVLSASEAISEQKESQAKRQRRIREAFAQQRRGPVPASPAHQDEILAMQAIEFPQKMLATAGRDGVVKIWV
eukprot:gb/GEZN01000231.1/.p1 GENE.gb/GEZN01000231.1/~~gb/GEZN01000231.1/.p1  ORF type:complete len:1689 (+),score=318.73 gb/GEZN01000231.1/:174-5240(+)